MGGGKRDGEEKPNLGTTEIVSDIRRGKKYAFFTSLLEMYFEWERRGHAWVLINLRASCRSPDILQQVARIAQRYKKVSLH